MKRLFALMTALAVCGPAQAAAEANAKLIDLNHNVVGHVHLQALHHGVLIEIEAKGLTPGPHAILLHTTASCDAATQFTSAGPVFSFDANRLHGYRAKGGPRTGDLPTQFAAADGTLHASIVSTAITLGNGARSIFDRDGVSIIVHANGDDYLSQPDGGAGTRVACGTIIRTIPPGRHGRKKK